MKFEIEKLTQVYNNYVEDESQECNFIIDKSNILSMHRLNDDDDVRIVFALTFFFTNKKYETLYQVAYSGASFEAWVLHEVSMREWFMHYCRRLGVALLTGPFRDYQLKTWKRVNKLD